MFGRLRAAACFLVPVPLGSTPVTEYELRRAAPWFPLAGAALGAVVAGIGVVGTAIAGPTVGAVVVVGALAWLTGGLHLDGLADTFDGLGGWRGDRDRFLAIMRDSRVGAHGVVALVIGLLAKAAALPAVLAAGPGGVFAGVVLACSVIPALLVGWPYAREQGTGTLLHEGATSTDALVALALGTGVAAAAGYGLPAVCAIIAAWLLARALAKRLGGLTGDAYGAVVELVEVTFWILAAGA
jgi:adenosylcobinamide-GDP ribazoletransferase